MGVQGRDSWYAGWIAMMCGFWCFSRLAVVPCEYKLTTVA